MSTRKGLQIALVSSLALTVSLAVLGCGTDTTTTTSTTAPPAGTTITAAETTTTTEEAHEPMNLKWAWHGPGAGKFPEAQQWAAAEIGARTNGVVNVEVFMNTLGTAQDAMSLTGQGSIDIAFVAGAFTLPQNPYLSTLSLPGGADQWAVFLAARDTLMTDPRVLGELEAQGVVPLNWINILGEVAVLSNKPINSAADLKGLKVRSLDQVSANLLTILGAVPVTMPGGEVYDAMDKGVIDAAYMPVKGILLAHLNEVSKYVWLPSYQGALDQPFLMNADSWKKMTADEQQTVLAVMDEFGQKVAQFTMEDDVPILDSLQNVDKILVVRFSPEEQAKVNDALEQVRQDWFNQWDAGKGFQTQDLYNKLEGLVAKYEQEVEDKGYPWAR